MLLLPQLTTVTTKMTSSQHQHPVAELEEVQTHTIPTLYYCKSQMLNREPSLIPKHFRNIIMAHKIWIAN